MIGFGSRSRPNVTGSATAGRPSCWGVAVVGKGLEGSDGGMSADWGGRESRGGVRLGGGGSVQRRQTPSVVGFPAAPRSWPCFPLGEESVTEASRKIF